MPYFDFKSVGKQKSVSKSKQVYGIKRSNANIAYGEFAKYGNDCAVYGIKNNITNKVYIGSTKHIQRRLLKHFNELYHSRHRNKRLQEDFNKYGFDSFSIIIYSTNENNLLEQEKDLQIKLGIDNIYNEKVTGYYMTDELKQMYANQDRSSHKTVEYREKMSKLKTNKVAQYTLDMQLIKIWDSAVQICETLGHTRSVILSCCNGSKPRAYGHNWRYVDDNGNIVTDGYAKARKKK